MCLRVMRGADIVLSVISVRSTKRDSELLNTVSAAMSSLTTAAVVG